jgi:hypothetical protein
MPSRVWVASIFPDDGIREHVGNPSRVCSQGPGKAGLCGRRAHYAQGQGCQR